MIRYPEYHENVYDRIQEFLLMNVIQYTIDHMLVVRLLWKSRPPIGSAPCKYVKKKKESNKPFIQSTSSNIGKNRETWQPWTPFSQLMIIKESGNT